MSGVASVEIVRTRFAPSPTGDLHLGGAWAALVSWLVARRRGANGRVVLRIEDLDPPRVVAGAEARIAADLAWLGLDADESPARGGPFAPYRQSERGALYRAALAPLETQGLVYPCDCSRADIARVASAPHPGEELVYPGTCRDLPPGRAMRRPPALRFRLPDGGADREVTAVDERLGALAQDLPRDVGDFVLVRGDGVFAYQLGVVVDDLAMKITDVVRGADLFASTPRQIALVRALAPDRAPPRFLHVPLVVDEEGDRLAKRTAGLTLRQLRAAGTRPEEIIGFFAFALGLAASEAPLEAGELAGRAAEAPPGPFRFRVDQGGGRDAVLHVPARFSRGVAS